METFLNFDFFYLKLYQKGTSRVFQYVQQYCKSYSALIVFYWFVMII